MTSFRLPLLATIIGLSLATPAAARFVSSSSSSEPRACTMEAKLCPDGETYVGRTGPNCEFAACPGGSASSSPSCAPYVCMDGTTHPGCTEDGHVINYFAEPCLTHGGDAGPFKDVPGNHANANAIAYLKAEGIVSGYADGTFKPDVTINRAEFVKILVGMHMQILKERQAQYPNGPFWEDSMCIVTMGSDDIPFPLSDVNKNEWYASSVCHAISQNLLDGYPDGTFRPATDINFAEAAKILAKSFGLEATTTVPACETSDCPWYRGFVMMLEAHAAIPDSILSFEQKITRGQMAEMVWRLDAGVTDLHSKTYAELSGGRRVGMGCQIGGCSAEVCGEASDEPIVSNCIYRPEFACYKAATCEKQSDGKCGWTQTEDLNRCLSDAR